MPLFARFLVVGGIGTLFSYGIYAFLLFCGLNYALSNLAALIAGILFSFKAQGRFVFLSGDNSLIWRFALCWGLIYAANVAFLRQAIHMGMDRYVAGAVAIPPIAVLSFVVQRYVVFRTSDPGRRGPPAGSAPPRTTERA